LNVNQSVKQTDQPGKRSISYMTIYS